MFIAKEEPLEKSTPEACKTALPPNLSAPLGSLQILSEHSEDKKHEAYTILLKLENGELILAGGFRR